MNPPNLRQTVALFRYGLIAEFVHLPPNSPGIYAKLRQKAESSYAIPGSTRTRVALETLRDWLKRYRRGGFDALLPQPRSDRGLSRTLSPVVADRLIFLKGELPQLSIPQLIRVAVERGIATEAQRLPRATVHRLLTTYGLSHRLTLSKQDIESHYAVFNECFEKASGRNFSKEQALLSFRWMLRLLQCQFDVAELQKELGGTLTCPDIEVLRHHIVEGGLSKRNRAIVVLAGIKKIPLIVIADFLSITPAVVSNINKSYKSLGLAGPFGPRKERPKKRNETKCKEAVFALLHSPPKSHDINRTSWTLETLSKVLRENGLVIGEHTITSIIRDAGFKFRKAKTTLTSTDPEYKAKLQEITHILENLKPDEKFFSVDEYGPFSVKMLGGKSLVRGDQLMVVPQYQKSKGQLIVTAALELCENQITHFYSGHKNTEEMLKLIDMLLAKYSSQSRIYFSWDAASWHASGKLSDRLDEINSDAYRTVHKTPRVTLAPLPSSAQFLNVIESVFSGMARAIIHNSDYQSVEECQAAIDRYVSERNAHFKTNPARAGNKIWGGERVPSIFSESHNCKDPLYR